MPSFTGFVVRDQGAAVRSTQIYWTLCAVECKSANSDEDAVPTHEVESPVGADPHQDSLGARVAAFRELSGMSLRALAAAASVSSSFVSQLERGQTNASVASLRKIAAALGVSPAQLLDDSVTHTRGVLRAADRPTLPLAGAEKYVVSVPPLRNLEIYAGSFAPGGSTGADMYTHGNSQEVLIVTAGSVVLELNTERYVMQRNDSIEFLSSVPHRVLNESTEPAEVLWVNSPPTPDALIHAETSSHTNPTNIKDPS